MSRFGRSDVTRALLESALELRAEVAWRQREESRAVDAFMAGIAGPLDGEWTATVRELAIAKAWQMGARYGATIAYIQIRNRALRRAWHDRQDARRAEIDRESAIIWRRMGGRS